MASLINQMRNAQIPPQQQPLQLNESIANVRNLMSYIKNAENQQAALANILQNNPNTPYIAQQLKGNTLENIARQMASMKGIDINNLINQLQN